MNWTDDMIALLKEKWGTGLTTAEIGALLGVSKNSVIGKAHRLGLAKRLPGNLPEGSPLPKRRERAPKKGTVWAGLRQDGAAAAAAAGAVNGDGGRVVPLRRPVVKEAPAVKAEVVKGGVATRVTAPAPAPVSAGVLKCQWPMGDRDGGDFHFCGEVVEEGRPYCTRHCKKAYVRR